jgi:hypothetical protein
MPNVSYAVQKAIRARLVSTPAVTALVPANSVLDVNERPAPDPSIILGEDQVIDPGTAIDRSLSRVHSTLHVWKKEGGLSGVKAIAAAVRDAIRQGRPTLEAGLQCADCRVSGMRFLRDPDGVTSHGIVTVETLVREAK